MVSMNATHFKQLINEFDPKSEEQRKAFEKITYQYPFFQSAYAHYLKTLKEQDQYNFNLILRKTAILSPDRNKLHHWLNAGSPKPEQREVPKIKTPVALNTEKKKDALEKDTASEITSKATLKKENKNTVKKPSVPSKEKIKKETTEDISMDFTKWVIYSEKGKIKPVPTASKIDEKISLIDKFLENKPKIPPVKKDQAKVDLAINNTFSKEELMTETLAKVYLEQKKYKKALYAYKILSLKYPEKNSLFANQIKKIKQLQQNS